MKKTRLFVFAAMLAAAFASCQKEENFEPQQQPEAPEVATVPFELSACTENSQMPTRLSLGKDFKPAWEEGDQLGVYDGVKIQQFDLTDLETSTFTGSLAEGATQLNAIYPYGAATAFSDGKFTASIPAEQVIEQGDSLATNALLAMAQPVEIGEGQVQFAFKNVCGLIRFEISKAGQVKEFIITGNKGEKFAGEGVIGFETRIENEVEKQVPVFAPSENAATVVKVRPAGENATFAEGTYYAAVAPVTFAEGFSVTLLTVNDAATVSKGTEKEMVIPRNSGMGLQDLVSIAEWDWKIYTVEQLLEWNAAPTSKSHHVELMADLDMKDVVWEPEDFAGVFEGNDHKIYNFKISRDGYCGFVKALDGTIQNLYLGTSDGTTYDGESEFVYTPDAAAGDWFHMGSVAGSINNGALISNVTNFIKIHTPDSEGQAKVCMGGIVSMGTGTATIDNCVNYGEIVCDATVGVVTGASNHQLGGIMCKTDGKVTISNCKNYGNISAAGAYVDNVGGIMANPNGNSTDKGDNKTYIKGCYNYGNITITKTTSAKSPMALGGIVGKLTGATIEDCHNEGNISSVCDVLTGIGGVVGIHALAFESKIINCSNGVLNDTQKGVLSFNPAEGTKQMALGGILGYVIDTYTEKETQGEGDEATIVDVLKYYNGKLTLQQCNNYAPIENGYVCMRNTGGICGAIGDITSSRDGLISSIQALVDNCNNYGAITISGTGTFSSWQRHVGGIAGMIYGSELGVTVSNCTNNATISTTATGGGEHRIAGIVGHVRYGKVEISMCTNNGEVKATESATNPRPAGIVSVAQEGTSIAISQCTNTKKITSASAVGNVYAGGVGAYLIGTELSGCKNQGVVEVTNCSAQVRSGGIAAYLVKGESVPGKISSCENSSTVECSVPNVSNADGNALEHNIGGILGYTNTAVEGCTTTSTAKVLIGGNTDKPRAGGIVGVAASGTSILSCTNNGAVESSPEGSRETTYLGGIAGYANNTTIGNAGKGCSNSGAVTLKTAAGWAHLGGIVGNAVSNTSIVDATNIGTISSSSTTGDEQRLGGLVGYANATTIKGNGEKTCINNGPVYITAASVVDVCSIGGVVGVATGNTKITNVYNNNKISFASNKACYLGGMVGVIEKNVTIDGCHNLSGGIIECTKAGATYCIGGILGRGRNWNNTDADGIVIKNSSNSAAINAKVTNRSVYAGGIVGIMEQGAKGGSTNAFEDCINSGKVTATITSTSGYYARIGGIAGGVSKSNVKIKGCVNDTAGEVKLDNVKSTEASHAGGIVGYAAQPGDFDGNTNKAKVGGSAAGNVYVGGIWALDSKTAGYTIGTVKNNVNYGEVYGTAGSGKTLGVGGLFGKITVATIDSENKNTNYGNVTSAGGALAGASNIASWSGKVGKNVKVNGVLWNTWTNEAAWLCPSATNPLTATYVNAPVAQ